MSWRPSTWVTLTSLAASPLLVACGESVTSSSASATPAVTVAAGDDACEVSSTELQAGQTTFAVTNEGSEVTEVYVYGEDAGEFTRVISEVENIGPGTSRDMSVDLPAGRYEVACKPGQTGDGIRTPVTVSGESGRDGEEAEPAYDREVELGTDGQQVTGVPQDATAGEAIEFKFTNESDGTRTLELKDPHGTVAGEVEDIAPGETGELVVDLDEAGTWQVVVEGDGVDDVIAELPVS